MNNGIGLLKKIEILSPLSDSELGQVYSLMRPLEFEKGEHIFSEGDPGDEMYIVSRGEVSITVKTSSGETVEIAVIKEGNFFGEMAIFDNAPRSACCSTKKKTFLLAFSKKDLFSLIESAPETAIKIMYKILAATTMRLQNTGAFLSEMVTWGENARKRAVTDEFTALYNRRFLDDALEDNFARARLDKKPLSLVMVDLDNFGKLNRMYGEATGDAVILSVIPVFRSVFRESDILSRYGGDEFTFILPDTGPDKAMELCGRAVDEIRKIDILEKKEGSIKKVSASMGIASFPDHASTSAELREKTDLALYSAKERGRDNAAVYAAEKPFFNTQKGRIRTVAEKNRIVCNILSLIESKDNFLVVGHKEPDEDCVASMAAFSLLLGKMSRNASVVLYKRYHHKFPYLINICRYNSVRFIESEEDIRGNFSAVIILDTPKPSMLEGDAATTAFLDDKSIVKVELDHHLGADSGYIGERDYSLVDEASSTCELIGYLALKLYSRKDCLERFQIADLFSRNFVLALITGMISDSGMGKYLKTNREKWFYKYFTTLFNGLLLKKTHKSSGNLSSMQDIFNELEKLSGDEERCYQYFISRKKSSSHISYVCLTLADMDYLYENYDQDLVITVSRYTANVLAEESGFLGLVSYYDNPEKSDLIQFRLRRSQGYTNLDLREVLGRFEIENGGGHPGAVGFRIEKKQIDDIGAYTEKLISVIESMVQNP